jgi:hypothetical protein
MSATGTQIDTALEPPSAGKQTPISSFFEWDANTPSNHLSYRMWGRAAGISDQDLVHFDIKKDLVEVRAGPTAYGVIILGKIRLPAVNDDLGEGYVHVRIHDPPDRVSQ